MNHLKARVKYGTKIKPKKGTAFGPKTRTKIERPKATTNRPKFQKLRPQESAKQSSFPIKTLANKTAQKPLSTTLPVQASLDLKVLNGQQRLLWKQSTDQRKFLCKTVAPLPAQSPGHAILPVTATSRRKQTFVAKSIREFCFESGSDLLELRRNLRIWILLSHPHNSSVLSHINLSFPVNTSGLGDCWRH